ISRSGFRPCLVRSRSGRDHGRRRRPDRRPDGGRVLRGRRHHHDGSARTAAGARPDDARHRGLGRRARVVDRPARGRRARPQPGRGRIDREQPRRLRGRADDRPGDLGGRGAHRRGEGFGMTGDLDAIRRLAGPTIAALEASRSRIDDLNVYPVPDGDTGTNLTLTVRAVQEALEQLDDADRERLAHEIARAALMGARGNSGVILSQIVRGFADVVGHASVIDSPALARAFRSASDAAYRAVRKPVEGTMLTVIRELAEEAEAQARPDLAVADLLRALVRRGEDALSRTPEHLEILRQAGVVDAGGAGLLELVRGLTAAVTGEAP